MKIEMMKGQMRVGFANGWYMSVAESQYFASYSVTIWDNHGNNWLFNESLDAMKTCQVGMDVAYVKTLASVNEMMNAVDRLPGTEYIKISAVAPKRAIARKMCKKCGGNIDNSGVCEDCACDGSDASAVDDGDNRFNSM